MAYTQSYTAHKIEVRCTAKISDPSYQQSIIILDMPEYWVFNTWGLALFSLNIHKTVVALLSKMTVSIKLNEAKCWILPDHQCSMANYLYFVKIDNISWGEQCRCVARINHGTTRL